MVNQAGGKKDWRRTAAVLFALVLCAVVSPWMGVMAGAHTFNHDTDLSTLVNETTNATAKPVSENTNFYLSRALETKTPIRINAGATVNLCLNGHTLTYTGTGASFITVLEGAELNIYDCGTATATVSSKADATQDIDIPAGHIFTTKAIINNTGTVNLHSGALTGSTTTAITNNGGAVFDMSGGMIAGCQGTTNGGAVNNKGTFTLSGGSIIGNLGTSGGIVNNAAGGTFEMSGGEITGNSGGTGSGGVKNAGSFIMSGGSITGNKGTSTSAGSGGAVYNTGTSAVLEMTGGEISGNETVGSGGGIYVGSGTVRISGNAVISGNTSGKTGGGIHMAGGSATMSGGSVMGNTAETDGGGIHMAGSALNVSGTPKIDNVYLASTSKSLTLTGPLEDGASIHVSGSTALTETDYTKSITVAKPSNYTITENDIKKIHYTPAVHNFVLLLEEGNVIFKSIADASFTVEAPTFEPVEYGYAQPDAKPITIRNTGNVELPITKAAINSTSTQYFILNSTAAVTVPVGGSSTQYTIQPKAGLTPNEYSATVTFTYKKPGASTPPTEKVIVTFEVAIASQDAPPQVTVNTVTKNSITINTIEKNSLGNAVEYSIDDGLSWVSPSSSTAVTYKFDKLNPNNEYSIIARYKAKTVSGKDCCYASPAGEPCIARTAADTVTRTVKFNANGGAVTPASGTTGPYGTLESPPALPVPTREDHTFLGWFASPTGGSEVTIQKVYTQLTTTIYAHWAQNEYNLTLNLGDGAVYSSLTKYRYGVVTALPEPAKAGFRFAGWHTDEACTSEPVTAISATDLGDKTFYAKWEEASVPTPTPEPATPTPAPSLSPTPSPSSAPSPTPGPGGGTGYEETVWDSADPYEIWVEGETRVPVIRLVAPQSVDIIVNPYRLTVDAREIGGGSQENGSIICPTRYLENYSEASIGVSAYVTGICGDDVEFAPAPGGWDPGKKAAFLQFNTELTADSQSPLTAAAHRTTLSLQEAVVPAVGMGLPGGDTPCLAFGFSGETAGGPDAPWTEEDVFGAVLVFRFTPMANPAA